MDFEQYSSIVQENVSLADRCWLGIGGSARYYAEPTCLEELQGIWRLAHSAGMTVRILGGGSNLLVRSEGVDGLVVKLSGELSEVVIDGNVVRAGAGADFGEVIGEAAAHGLAGLELLAGIPGTVGGAVVGNAGVSNDDVGSHLASVVAITRDGETVEFVREQLQFGYRQSNLDGLVVLQVAFELEPGDSAEITRRMQSAWIKKKASQPAPGQVAQGLMESSGYKLADLLEAAGMRSATEGEAAMLPQHPGYVVVNENADAEQVLALTKKIIRAVEVQSGIQLRSPLKIW